MKFKIFLGLITVIMLVMVGLQGYDHILSIEMKQKSIPQQVVEHVTIEDTVGLSKFKKEFIVEYQKQYAKDIHDKYQKYLEYQMDSMTKLFTKHYVDTTTKLVSYITQYANAYQVLRQEKDSLKDKLYRAVKIIDDYQLKLSRADSIIRFLYLEVQVNREDSARIDSSLIRINSDTTIVDSSIVAIDSMLHLRDSFIHIRDSLGEIIDSTETSATNSGEIYLKIGDWFLIAFIFLFLLGLLGIVVSSP